MPSMKFFCCSYQKETLLVCHDQARFNVISMMKKVARFAVLLSLSISLYFFTHKIDRSAPLGCIVVWNILGMNASNESFSV